MIREFHFLDEKEHVKLTFRETYPRISLSYSDESRGRQHVVKLNDNLVGLNWVNMQDAEAIYSIGALRLAVRKPYLDISKHFAVKLNADMMLVVHSKGHGIKVATKVLPHEPDNYE